MIQLFRNLVETVRRIQSEVIRYYYYYDINDENLDCTLSKRLNEEVTVEIQSV